jgi:hypothetical protein
LFTLERVGSSPKAQVVPRLEDEGHWKRGTFPKTRKLEMGCGYYPYGLYLDLPYNHRFSSSQHSLTSACSKFFYLCHFWAIFMFFGKSLLVLLLVFRNCYLKQVATNTCPWGPGNHYSKLPPRIPHRHFIHWKKQGPKP